MTRFLVVSAFPAGDRIGDQPLEAVIAALTEARCEYSVRALHHEGFRATMSASERHAYDTDNGVISDDVASHVDDVRQSTGIVFVYPSQRCTLPPILKGWLERVLVPGVAFQLDERTRKVTPALGHIRQLVGVATYPESRAAVLRAHDGGRRTITRALRLVCGLSTRTSWYPMYDVERSTVIQHREFATRVRRDLARRVQA